MHRGIIFLIALVASVAAVERCGFARQYQAELRRNPDKAGRVSQALGQLVPDDGRRLVVRVKVHVLYRTLEENVSDEQIHSQFAVLNQDYGGTNNDKSYTLPMFQPLIGTPNIEFVLDSINRKQVSRGTWWNSDNVPDESGIAPVEPARFLNIWILNQGGPGGPDDLSVLGYACLPPCDPTRDGIVMDHHAFGTMGTVQAPYNLGRTMTHEMGHYFGLWHTFGEEPYGCSNTDYVDDTPTTDRPRFGCFDNQRPVRACNSNVLTENFMDYGDDRCITMFTQGQVTRMRQSILQYRSGLVQSTTSTPTPTPRPKGNNPTPTPKPTPKRKTPKPTPKRKRTPKPTPKKRTPKPTPKITKKKNQVGVRTTVSEGENTMSFAAGAF